MHPPIEVGVPVAVDDIESLALAVLVMDWRGDLLFDEVPVELLEELLVACKRRRRGFKTMAEGDGEAVAVAVAAAEPPREVGAPAAGAIFESAKPRAGKAQSASSAITGSARRLAARARGAPRGRAQPRAPTPHGGGAGAGGAAGTKFTNSHAKHAKKPVAEAQRKRRSQGGAPSGWRGSLAKLEPQARAAHALAQKAARRRDCTDIFTRSKAARRAWRRRKHAAA
jgi:hypothetical protein